MELVDERRKKLSHARKEILLKFIAQAIPFYVMSVFEIPLSLYDDTKNIMNAF